MDLFSAITEFVRNYFLNPLEDPQKYGPFNPVNTLAYAAIALAAIYLIYRLIRQLGIEINEQFFYSIIPFVFLGSTIRVCVDAKVLPRELYLITPGIYVTVFIATISSILFALALQKKKGVHLAKTVKAIGVMLALTALFFLLIKTGFSLPNVRYGVMIIALALVGVGTLELLNRVRKKTSGNLERMTVLSQGFDGAASFIGVQFGGYAGQHVVENFIFGSIGPVFFFLIKVAFAILLVEIVGRELKESRERETRGYILLIITVFGLAPGLRDFLRIVLGV
ncbi:DUF63 family protein [Candidatus Micrarchaeota archaeon]|nr:DUF63 family protein [Candidatus Micrarchaeota archaeon]